MSEALPDCTVRASKFARAVKPVAVAEITFTFVVSRLTLGAVENELAKLTEATSPPKKFDGYKIPDARVGPNLFTVTAPFANAAVLTAPAARLPEVTALLASIMVVIAPDETVFATCATLALPASSARTAYGAVVRAWRGARVV